MPPCARLCAALARAAALCARLCAAACWWRAAAAAPLASAGGEKGSEGERVVWEERESCVDLGFHLGENFLQREEKVLLRSERKE